MDLVPSRLTTQLLSKVDDYQEANQNSSDSISDTETDITEEGLRNPEVGTYFHCSCILSTSSRCV